MTDKTINALTATTTAVAADEIPMWVAGSAVTRKITRANFLTGYAALATASTWTAAQTMQAGVNIGVASAQLYRPAAGVVRQKLEGVTLADTGALVVATGTGRALVYVYYATIGVSALVAVDGSGSSTLIYGSTSYFGTTAGTASRINVYASGTNVTVQNLRGADAFIYCWALN
jgi:hypothetical protein